MRCEGLGWDDWCRRAVGAQVEHSWAGVLKDSGLCGVIVYQGLYAAGEQRGQEGRFLLGAGEACARGVGDSHNRVLGGDPGVPGAQ